MQLKGDNAPGSDTSRSLALLGCRLEQHGINSAAAVGLTCVTGAWHVVVFLPGSDALSQQLPFLWGQQQQQQPSGGARNNRAPGRQQDFAASQLLANESKQTHVARRHLTHTAAVVAIKTCRQRAPAPHD
jgi:hypothetical protein